MIELLPWAMLANGPACTNAGCPSSVCIRLGISASFIRTVTAPATPSCSTLTGSPFLLRPTIILPNRSRMSSNEVVNARIAMISEATLISKPVARGNTGLGEPSFSLSSLKPTRISRRARSHTSTTRRQVMVFGSMSRRFRPRLASCSSVWRLSWYRRVSSAAATRLCDTVIAWMSPVRCRLKSSIGTTCE